MKIRTAYTLSSLGVLSAIAIVLAASPLMFGMERVDGKKPKAGSAVAKDPFVKVAGTGSPGAGKAAPAKAKVDDPFAVGVGGKKVGGESELVAEPVALLEWIQTDLATANRLVEEYGWVENVAPLREKLEGMIDAGEAKLVETSFLRTMPGQRMKTQSVLEHIYPTQFDPPEMPQQNEGKSTPPPISSANPTAFDMRPVGTTVEFEPITGPGAVGERFITVNIAPEIVRHLGDRSVAPDGTPEFRVVQQPDFATMKLTSSVVVKEGSTSLLALLKPAFDHGQRVLVLLSADCLRGSPPEALVRDAQNPVPAKMVTHIEWIAVDHRTANKLLRGGYNQRDAAVTRNSLAEMIKAGTAELVESSYVKSLPGQRVTIESIREHSYATEFDPPQLPQKLNLDGAPVRSIGANPTSFETRNVGTTVELEVNVDGQYRYASVNFAPEIVGYVGDRPVAGDAPLEMKNLVHPKFYTMKLHTNISTFFGQRNLTGVFTSNGDDDKRLMMFVKVDVLR